MSNLYTDEELAQLDKYQQVRNKTIDAIIKDGYDSVVKENRRIEVLNALLASGEKTVTDRVNARLKHEDNTNREALIEQVAMIIKETHKNRISAINNQTLTTDLPNELMPVDFVPGEKEINPEPLKLEDFQIENN